MPTQQASEQTLRALSIIFKGSVSEELINIWTVALTDLTDEDMATGLQVALRTHKDPFLPTPALFREYAIGRDDQDTRTELAWRQLMTAISTHGSYPTIRWKDKALCATVLDLGGMPALCEREAEDLNFLRKQFKALYQSHLVASPDGLPEYTVGRTEQSNQVRGLTTRDQPKLVGYSADEREALRLEYQNHITNGAQ